MVILFSGVIDYNFLCFRNAIQQVFEVRNKALATTSSANNHSTSPSSALINESSGSPIAGQSSNHGQNGTIVIA